jgi:hypothetical protein
MAVYGPAVGCKSINAGMRGSNLPPTQTRDLPEQPLETVVHAPLTRATRIVLYMCASIDDTPIKPTVCSMEWLWTARGLSPDSI